MVALIARAGALSGAYSFKELSSFFSCCFSLLANCLESLHGVSPEISAAAGSAGTVDETRIDDSSSAADKAFKETYPSAPLFLSSVAPEHTMLELVTLRDPRCDVFDSSSGWMKLVEIVNDIFVGCLDNVFDENV